MNEAAALSKRTTKKALEDLQEQLLQSPQLLNRHVDMMTESDKPAQANLLRRFAEGSYPGVPYTVKPDDHSRGTSAFSWWVRLLVVAAVVAVCAAGAALYAKQQQR